MKSDPPKGGTKNDSKLPEETKVVRKEPELGAVEAGGAGDQLTIAEMENVTTVFRSGVNNHKPMTEFPPTHLRTFYWFVKLIN